MAARDLTVVVPVLDEAANVGPLLGMLREALDGLDWEVVFVDEDSHVKGERDPAGQRTNCVQSRR